jgi:hypothetical protein
MAVIGKLLALALAAALIAILFSVATPAVRGATAEVAISPEFARPYTVAFTETGLPSGTNWSVHIAYLGCGCQGVTTTVKSHTPTISIPVSNGTYRYAVLLVPGFFVNGSARGMFNVSGADVGPIAVLFHPVFSFEVQFNETGLPSGTAWTVSITGNGTGQLRTIESQTETTLGTTMAFMLPNGTYHYVVSRVPGSFFVGHASYGRFVVAGASPAPIPVAFLTPPTYAVTFNETGLALGTNWSVMVNGAGTVAIHQIVSSTSTNLSFSLPSGSYHYVVAEVLGFNVVGAAAGSFVLTNVPRGFNVTFAPVAPGEFYPVAFQESGLPSGTHWAVTVIATHTFGHSHTAEKSADSPTIFFLLQNGSYRFVVHSLLPYTIVSGGSGTFAIHGSAPGVQVVQFAAKPTYAVTFTESGLPVGTNWTVLVRTEYAGSSLWPIHEAMRANTSSLAFDLPNGTYCFTIYGVHGYYISSGFPVGPFTVSGASPPGITVGFSPRS